MKDPIVNGRSCLRTGLRCLTSLFRWWKCCMSKKENALNQRIIVQFKAFLERDTSLELATYCLGSSHSTGWANPAWLNYFTASLRFCQSCFWFSLVPPDGLLYNEITFSFLIFVWEVSWWKRFWRSLPQFLLWRLFSSFSAGIFCSHPPTLTWPVSSAYWFSPCWSTLSGAFLRKLISWRSGLTRWNNPLGEIPDRL